MAAHMKVVESERASGRVAQKGLRAFGVNYVWSAEIDLIMKQQGIIDFYRG